MNTDSFSKGNANIFISGPAGDLECATSWPVEVKRKLVMLVCHPHPLHLGTMNNKVVTTLCRCANKMGIPSVRFNFRGVGKSVGLFDNAIEKSDGTFGADDISVGFIYTYGESKKCTAPLCK